MYLTLPWETRSSRRPQRLLERCDGVGCVDLIEVDVVSMQTFERLLDTVHNVAARGANVVSAWTGTAKYFGCDHQVFAFDAGAPDGLP